MGMQEGRKEGSGEYLPIAFGRALLLHLDWTRPRRLPRVRSFRPGHGTFASGALWVQVVGVGREALYRKGKQASRPTANHNPIITPHTATVPVAATTT